MTLKKGGKNLYRYSFLICLLLVACTISLPEPTPRPPIQPEASLTPTLELPPAGTSTQPHLVTPSPAPIQLPPGAISEQNVDRLSELQQLGKGSLRQLIWSPDGSRFALITSLGVSIYDAQSMVEERFFETQSSDFGVAFAHDWKNMVWWQGASIRLLSLPDGALLRLLESRRGNMHGGSFSPDGKLFVGIVEPSGGLGSSHVMEMWRTSNWTLRRTWDIGPVAGMAFSPDGSGIVSWNAFRMQGVQRWQVEDGSPLPGLEEISPIWLAYSPDGKTLATAELDGIVYLRDAEDGKSLRQLSGHERSVTRVSFSPDGSSLVSASEDGTALVWRVEDGQLMQTFEIGDGWDAIAVFSPDGDTLALGSAGRLSFHRVEDGSLLNVLEGFTSGVRELAISPDGDTLGGAMIAVLDGDGTSEKSNLRLWRAADATQLYASSGHPALSMAFSPDGKRLALGMWNGEIRLLRVSEDNLPDFAALEQTLEGHSAQVQSVAFSPDGSLLASGSLQEMRVWRIADGRLLYKRAVSAAWVNGLAFLPQGDRLASFSADGILRLWQVSDGKPLTTLQTGEPGWDGGLAFSTDGSALALGVHDRILLLDTLDAGEKQAWPVTGGVTHLAFSLDGSLLAFGLNDHTIQLLRASDGARLHTLRGHTGPVSALAFTPDGRFIVSGSEDGTVRIWGLYD